MSNLIRSKFKCPSVLVFHVAFAIGLSLETHPGRKAKLFSGHQSYAKRAVFIDREEAFVVRQAHKHLLNLVNLRSVFWIIARKYDFRFTPLIAPCVYHATYR